MKMKTTFDIDSEHMLHWLISNHEVPPFFLLLVAFDTLLICSLQPVKKSIMCLSK